MKKCDVCCIAALALLLSAGCGQGPGTGKAPDRAAELQKIDGLRSRFVAAYNSADAAAAAALYTDDAVMLPANEPAVEGRQAIQESLRRELGQGPTKISITPQETEIAGEWAFERGQAVITTTPKGAKDAVELSAKYLVILRRQPDGDWKIHRDMTNLDTPSPQAAGGSQVSKK
ncbi:MAG: SgcJ/EcaC family oxidoreductase [Bryobacteraceae bacterium]|nr:SgcJ/EcaC family oxidoreductase [Bryobacteraceae bacterium]